MHKPSLKVFPLKGLVDEEISIIVSGLVPHSEIWLRSQMRGVRGEIWRGEALFKSNAEGIVSPSSMAPLTGSYEGIDSMGLVWSMTSPGASLFRSFQEKMEMTFILEVNQKEISRKVAVRSNQSRDVQKISIREDGLVASFFFSRTEKKMPGVIVLGGSGGELSEARAQLLASRGFAVLALAYFGCEGLPSTLKNIPIEYFEKGLDWLSNHPLVDSQKIGIWGTSRGGELALILGTIFPSRICSIAAHVPSSAIYGALDGTDAPAWLYKGMPLLQNAPFPSIHQISLEGNSKEKAISTTPLFLEGMKREKEFLAAEIPIEKIQCPLLLVSGQDDRMWPSDLFCKRIQTKAKNCIHLSYPLAGHYLSPPYLPTSEQVDFHPVFKRWFHFGGSPQETAFARVDAWKKTVNFFKNLGTV